jgi:hypothetical protein
MEYPLALSFGRSTRRRGAASRRKSWAGRIAPGAGAILALGLAATAVSAQERDPMLLHQGDGLSVRAHLQFGINAVGERNLFWNFADSVAPGSGFDSDAN